MKRLISFSIAKILIAIFFVNTETHAQETVVHDEIIDWEWERGSWYGGNTFYWWHRPYEADIVNYGDMSSTNWISPFNYRNGEFYLRFEVISQPSKEDFHIQFGIWQDYGKSGGYSETVSALADLDGGAGSLVETSIGSPRRWWQKRTDEKVDFSRPEDFYRIGIILWNSSPRCLPMAQGWNNDNACDDAETVALRFFPMKARVTVVAVAEGYNFSGWENYASKPDTPNFSIDFDQEQTGEVIPSDVEYASKSDMSGATDGKDKKIPLAPGEDLFFRVKASGNNPASNIQHLVVPERPEAPGLALTIDYETERTDQNIPDNIEYSDTPDFTSVNPGNNVPADFPPGTTLYFRFMATGDSFASNAQPFESDNRPNAPVIEINFPEEITTPVPGDIIYSEEIDFAEFQEGDETPLQVEPGTSIFLRKKSTDSQYASEILELTVPDRPSISPLTIDFTKETTVESISPLMFYSDSPDMTDAESGTGEPITVIPGSSVYFQIPASESSFRSESYELDIPARPELKLLIPEPVTVYPVPVEVLFPHDITGFSTNDVRISNGTVDSIDSDLIAFITPQSEGFVQLFIPTNVVDQGNFTSFNLRFNVSNLTGLDGADQYLDFRIFPSPAASDIILEYDGFNSSSRYEVWNLHAKILKSGMLTGRRTNIPLEGLTPGIYFITLKCHGCQDRYIKFMKE